MLSGGGARAFAHLGVLDELQAAGIQIDRYGGASMGSIVAGIAAMGTSVEELHDIFVRCFVRQNPSRDYTLPAYGLIRGARTRKLLADVFGDRRIEELAHRFFCVSCDLFARELVVHRTGPAAEAVYTSLAIPGVYPPVTGGGRLLVDGGVMDNLPVGTMAAAAEGPVIAVDVSHRGGPMAPPRRPRLEPFKRPLRRALTGSEAPLRAWARRCCARWRSGASTPRRSASGTRTWSSRRRSRACGCSSGSSSTGRARWGATRRRPRSIRRAS